MAKIVVVTGASGYIATEVIAQLVKTDYIVRGTVRSLDNAEKISHLQTLFPSVTLYESDLLIENSFDEVCEGANYVIHCASPFLSSVEDPQRDLVDPAVKGTLNVLSACIKSKDTIEAVVVTSSGAAIVPQFYEEDINKVWDENDWNDNSTLEAGPYRLSKSLAEREVWKIAEENPEIRFSTICPTFVLGPPRSNRTDSVSIQVMKSIIDGTAKEEGGVKRSKFGMVDVRNVALAHIRAAEKEVTGRFMVSSETGMDYIDLVEIINSLFPGLPLPQTSIGEPLTPLRYSREKAESILGIQFIPIEQTLHDMVQALIDLNLHLKQD